MDRDRYASSRSPVGDMLKGEPKPEPNAALREIAGRIKKLSYRDMQLLAKAIGEASKAETLEEQLLTAADKLENA